MVEPVLTEESARPLFSRSDPLGVEWAVTPGLVEYAPAVQAMEARVAAIAAGRAPELVWLVEHPPIYTAGVSARPGELLQPGRFPVFQTGRGGRFTYHGPGQRVAYVMLDLSARRRDVKAFVQALGLWLVDALTELGVEATARDDLVGVWVSGDRGAQAKIAAIGVKLRRWVSFHGLSLNVDPDLSHFDGIVPCGVTDRGVTSLAALGRSVTMASADVALRRAFARVFGPVEAGSPLI
jgi:lipoyl(octanoyl) transferase